MKWIFALPILLLPFLARSEERVSFHGDITPKSLSSLEQRILKAVTSFKKLDERVVVVELNSGGGNLFATLTFVEQIQQAAKLHNFTLVTRVRSACESSCTVLFTAGSIRQATKAAEFGFHSPAIASKLPRGMDRKTVLQQARDRWLGAIGRVDLPLSYEIDRKGYLLNSQMRYLSGKQLNTGYVSELIK